MDWEEKGRGIGHFQSYMHAHKKHNSHSEVDDGLGGNNERHWSLPVIHAQTKHNLPPDVDSEFGGKGRDIGHSVQSYMDTQNTTHTLKLI